MDKENKVQLLKDLAAGRIKPSEIKRPEPVPLTRDEINFLIKVQRDNMSSDDEARMTNIANRLQSGALSLDLVSYEDLYSIKYKRAPQKTVYQ